MFPDLTSDDIFHLETKRLWLRWPRAADAAAIASFASEAETARMTAAIPHPYPPGEAERFILSSRADNANGKSLVLAITQKSGCRPTIGLVSATPSQAREIELGYVVAPAARGKGIASEAAKALVETVFGLTNADRILANARAINPASRRVLEKCGFVYIDTGLDHLPARGGLHPCDRFQLDRKTWAANRWSRQLRPMVHQVHESDERPTEDAAAPTRAEA